MPAEESANDATEAVETVRREGEEIGRLVRLYDNEDREAGLRALVDAIERLNSDALQAQLFVAVATIAEIKAGRVVLPTRVEPDPP